MVMKSVLKNQAFLTRDTLGLFVLCSVAVCGMTLFLSVHGRQYVCWGKGDVAINVWSEPALKADPKGLNKIWN